jgi:hypothetical protein
VTHEPKSSPQRWRAPIKLASGCLILLALALPVGAQAPDRTTAIADFAKEPGGTVLGQVMRGAAVTFGEVNGDWREATVEGWIAGNSLRADRRDGFDVSIAVQNGARIRTSPSSTASVRVMARFGALFQQTETRGSWVRVRRTAWVPQTATVVATDDTAPDSATVPVVPQVPDTGQVTLRAGHPYSTGRGGMPIGQLETDTRVELLERSDGWNRIVIEAWVPDAALSGAGLPDGITSAMIQAEPDRYVGQTVEWVLQVLALRTADELRPELPLGQPYVLARGPLPETGFVYLIVGPEEEAQFREMEPLNEVTVRATIRAGRTRHLPTPVLDLVRVLD